MSTIRKTERSPSMQHQRLDEQLAAHPNIEKRRKFLFFSELIYRPTGEKITEGFRYYNCGIEQVASAAAHGDFGTLSQLPFALDEDGDRDTSSVLVDLAYTASGSLVAVQPVKYQNYAPTAVTAPVIFEGPAGQAVVATAKYLGD